MSAVSSPAAAPRHGPPRALGIVAALAVAAAVVVAYRTWSIPAGPTPLTASGTIEATEVTIAAESAGRVREVLVREGEAVRTGQELVRLDDTLLQIQFRQSPPETQQILREQIDRLTLRSPIDGEVIHRTVEPGEVAAAGAPLLIVADVANLDLTLFILQRDIGRVLVGMPVEITTDSLPGETFGGVVTSVASRAEFTPRNVQTQRDRLSLVFAVRVAVASDGRLKAGMPADAKLDG
ncbi:MAG: efflux RND transporter periplasmic adaptor subunit [Dehalococcoidia bacterium]